MESKPEYNPAQLEIINLLGADRDQRPQFDAVLRHELRHALEDGLADHADRSSEDQLWISKHLLGQVMGCEKKFVADKSAPFEWAVPIARGSVAHKAIELSIHKKGHPAPLDLVDDAIATLSAGIDGLAEYLQTCGTVAVAELRAEANDSVVKFMESFPPLSPRWWPTTESRLRLDIHDRFIFSGKVDLTLGRADGNTAGKVLIDLKTGSMSPLHAEDLRFYALLETIRVGTPPRLVASFYLDRGVIQAEAVTESVLEAAVRRVIAGVGRLVALNEAEREPSVAPGPSCRWCPALEDCEQGRIQNETRDDY